MRSLIFTRARRPLLDLPIRAFEGGTAGHVGCVLGNQVVDATFAQGGVRLHALDQWQAHRIVVAQVPVDMPNPATADDWLLEQVGRPYDWTALLGFLAWRDWADDHAWYCSELAAAWLIVGGVDPLLATRRSRIGVRLLHEVAHALALARRQE